MTEQPVFSARAVEPFTPPGSPRTYHVAPLTFRERVAYRAELTRLAGTYPSDAALLRALREAVRVHSPSNAADLIAVIDAAEADAADAEAHAQLGAIEAACAAVPVYSELLSARQRYMGMLPYVAAKHALRGWEGEALPPFAARLGVVPDDLLEVLPTDELEMVGWRASVLMQPGRAALGNSASPSLSPASPAPVTGASSRKTAGAGSSRGKSSRRTRA